MTGKNQKRKANAIHTIWFLPNALFCSRIEPIRPSFSISVFGLNNNISIIILQQLLPTERVENSYAPTSRLKRTSMTFTQISLSLDVKRSSCWLKSVVFASFFSYEVAVIVKQAAIFEIHAD